MMGDVNTGAAIFYDEEFQEEVLSLLSDIKENTSVDTGSCVTGSSIVSDEKIDTILSLNTACTFCLSLIVGLLIFNVFTRGLK